MPNLGCIIVDEEHDPSYKQGEGVRYHGRDLAIVRAQKSDVPVLLGSATPSLETYSRACGEDPRTHLHKLTKRATGANLPPITLIDMRQQRRGDVLSEPLEKALEETLARGEQAMLLLNRRGWAPSITCLDCGGRQECTTCSIPMVLHRPGYLLCHLCGWRGAPPKACAGCGSSALHDIGVGTQQLEELCSARFAGHRVARLDSDTATSARRLEQTLAAFAGGEIDLLVGTQMLSKGHDIAAVTLVGVVNADQGLRIPDPRGPERTFSLLTQVAGRAGRAGRPGRVFFQVYDPEHSAVRAAVEHDAEGFLVAELEKRAALGLPPARRAVTITCAHIDQQQALAVAQRFAQLRHPDVTLLGPAPAVVARVRNRYRIQLLATAKQAQTLQEWLDGAVALRRSCKSSGVSVAIDVDPNELM
jgi:primosomal protein N' (replication factor Y)